MPNLVSSNLEVLKHLSGDLPCQSPLDIVTDTDKRTLECSNTNIAANIYTDQNENTSVPSSTIKLSSCL